MADLPTDADEQLDAIIERVSGLARLELDSRLELHGRSDKLDGLSLGLNSLAEELHSSTLTRNYLGRVLGAMGDALFVVDVRGVIADTNAKASTITGLQSDVLVGASLPAMLSGGPSWDAWLQLAASGEAAHEVFLLGADGERHCVQLVVTPLGTHSGAGFVCVASDLSRQKQLEAALEKALREATTAARHKSEFLANMSHEIRTPINGVIGMTRLLCDTGLAPLQREMADAVDVSATALLDVVNDVLDFSKIESGRLEFESVDFDLQEVIEELLDVHAHAAQRKGLELILSQHAETPAWVRGDPGRVRQVLNNLLSNAIKFTKTGEVTLLVGPAGNDIAFAVSDTGIGIAADAIDRVFESFRQADSSTSRRFGGTGLGLAIAQKLVEQMGGRLGCSSEVGRGTRFDFTLRLPVGTRPTRAADTALLDGLRVLVVNGHRTNLEVLKQALESLGGRPTLASDGSQAIALVRAAEAAGQPFALRVLDCQMPAMGGLALARALHADPEVKAAPTLLLTSIGQCPTESELSEAHIHGVLFKPCRPRRLARAIGALLRGEGHVGAAPRADVTNRPRFGRVRILVVEDNAINQKVALGYLQRFGLRAVAVGDGVEALEALDRIRYDLILMDIRMPIMDGYEATRTIRANSPAADRPIIIGLSADTVLEARQRCSAAGMDDFLPKPVTEHRLLEALRRWLPDESADTAAKPLTEALPAKPTPALLDPTAFKQLRTLGVATGQPEIVGDMIGRFKTSAPSRIASIRKAVYSSDRPNIEFEAHTLRGSCLALGALELAETCRQIETSGDAVSPDRLHQLTAHAEDTLSRTLDAMEAFWAAARIDADGVPEDR